MKQILDIYRFVSTTKKNHKILHHLTKKTEFEVSGRSFKPWQASANAKQNFKKKYFWKKFLEIEDIFEDAVHYKYIETRHIVDKNLITGEVMQPDVEQMLITKKGRKLLDRAFIIVPSGLLYAWYKEDGKLFISIMIGLVTLLTGIVVLLIKIAYELVKLG